MVHQIAGGAGGAGRGNVNPPAAAQPAAPPRPRLGMAAQFEWDRQYAKTHNADGTAKGTVAPAAPAAPAGMGVAPPAPRGGNLRNANAENLLKTTESRQRSELTNFEESVDRMRRLSTMLKG